MRTLHNTTIIAHVDHGKTTLVDQLLRQAGTFCENEQIAERVMDLNDIEKERDITILAKNCAVEYNGTHINIVDTPRHVDFDGEVGRVLSMVDGVLLLVDAVEGPMPQTCLVTRKALALGLKPIVVINKVDRPGARPEQVINQAFDLFDKLGANDDQLDFPVAYASGLNGYADLTDDVREDDMKPLFETILDKMPQRNDDPNGPFQLQIISLDYSSYVGKIGIGHITRSRVRPLQGVVVKFGPEGNSIKGRINQVLKFRGLERELVQEAEAGSIVLTNGIEELGISCTVCAPDAQEALPMLEVDEPTLTMNFCVNTSPLTGREGKFVTSRQLRDRLDRELKSNVAPHVKDTGDDTVFEVSGHGELYLTIPVENTCREGYELAVSRPRVVFREIDGVKYESFKRLTVDVENGHQGGVMEELGRRKGELLDMASDGKGRTRSEYRIPVRGLIGFQGEFLTLTRGMGLISHTFGDYSPIKGSDLGERHNGVLIPQDDDAAVAYALWKLQDRGHMFVSPGDALYEGMIVDIHSRDNDLVVNPIKGKQLTNMRASDTDEAVRLVPPIQISLEYVVEFIADDELMEVTPKNIRLRRRHLEGHEHKRASREEVV